MTPPVKHRHHLRHLDDYQARKECARAIERGMATVIRVGRPITFAANLADARELLGELATKKDAPKTLVAWPGHKSTHVFELDASVALELYTLTA